jgi:hypothetical protein
VAQEKRVTILSRAVRAGDVAKGVLARVREKLGFE